MRERQSECNIAQTFYFRKVKIGGDQNARIIKCNSVIVVDQPELIRGKRALVVEDGPTLTHGGMSYGAGWFAAKSCGASEIVDPKPYDRGSLRATYEKYPNAGGILPAMGYGDQQIQDLEATIDATPADVVVEGTPINLKRNIKVNKPMQRVRYELQEIGQPTLEEILKAKFGE